MFSTEAHAVHLDDQDDSTPVIATAHPASDEAVGKVFQARIDDGSFGGPQDTARAPFMWLTLANGSKWLAIYPYIGLVSQVYDDAMTPAHLPECNVPDFPPEVEELLEAAPSKLAVHLVQGDHIFWNLARDNVAEVASVRFSRGGMSEVVVSLAYKDAFGDRVEDVDWDADADVKLVASARPTVATLEHTPTPPLDEVPDLVEFETAKKLTVHFASGACVDLEPGWTNTNVGIHGRERGHDVARQPYLTDVFVPWAHVCMTRQRKGES